MEKINCCLSSFPFKTTNHVINIQLIHRKWARELQTGFAEQMLANFWQMAPVA